MMTAAQTAAREIFFRAKNDLIGSADMAGQQCLLFWGNSEEVSGYVMSLNTSLTDPCIQSSMSRLFASLPLAVKQELGKSLAQLE